MGELLGTDVSTLDGRESTLIFLRPGQIYEAFIEGHERGPVVIISREELNRGYYVVAVPFTTKRLDVRRNLPNCVFFEAGSFGLKRDCVAQAEAIAQLPRSNLRLETGPVGLLENDSLERLKQAVGYMMAAEHTPTITR